MLARLHYIADHHGDASPAPLFATVAAVVDAGVRCVQVRSKDCPDVLRYKVAEAVVEQCHRAGAMCVINDRVDIALATGADGAHVGTEDLPLAAARRLLGPTAVLGASASNVDEALAAVAAGADYLGVGPCYPTISKELAVAPIGPRGLAAVAAVAAAAGLPVVAIGGVGPGQIPELLAAGAYGVAVISAIAGAADPASAARQLLALLEGSPGPGQRLAG